MTLTIPDYTYRVKEVVRVIDGDTVDIIIDLGFYLNSLKRIRILDLDTDEMRGGTVETKERAQKAKERLEQLLSMGTVYIRTEMDATGKYGRLLGSFFVINDGTAIDVTKTLVAEGYQKGNTSVLVENINRVPIR